MKRTDEPTNIQINRTPVLTLWAAVVAEQLGYDHDAGLTLGKAVAGLTAQGKGRTLGIYKTRETAEKPKQRRPDEQLWIEVCGQPVPAVQTAQGVRAVVGDKPIDPSSVASYLEKGFGEELGSATGAMKTLAEALTPDELAQSAYELYQRFRPSIPSGKRGWGAKGTLDLNLIRSLAERS